MFYYQSEPAPVSEGDENNSASSEPNASTSSSGPGAGEMKGQITFQKLLDDLPEKVSGQTAKNLSVPIAFVCLLHLANEKVSWFINFIFLFYFFILLLKPQSTVWALTLEKI